MLRLPLVSLLVSSLALAAPDALTPLLQKVGQREAVKAQALESVTVTVKGTQQELDGHGRVQHTTETVVKTTHENGKRVNTLVRAVQDGKDISAQVKKRMEGETADGESYRTEDPFSPELQADYRFATVPDPKSPNLVKIHFAPLKPAPERMVGDAWVDPPSGELVRLVAAPAIPPSHMDRAQLVEDFAAASPWGRLRSKLSMSADGTIMWFIHRHLRGTAEFSYELPSPKP